MHFFSHTSQPYGQHYWNQPAAAHIQHMIGVAIIRDILSSLHYNSINYFLQKYNETMPQRPSFFCIKLPAHQVHTSHKSTTKQWNANGRWQTWLISMCLVLPMQSLQLLLWIVDLSPRQRHWNLTTVSLH